MDPTGTVLKKVTKEEALSKHFLHRAVHIIVLNGTGEMLIQQRAAEKSYRPLEWSAAAAGHVTSGETPAEAAVRELKEELGITTSLTAIGEFIVDDLFEHELVTVFVGTSTQKFTVQKEEVAQAKWCALHDLQNKTTGLQLIPHFVKALELFFRKTRE